MRDCSLKLWIGIWGWSAGYRKNVVLSEETPQGATSKRNWTIIIRRLTLEGFVGGWRWRVVKLNGDDVGGGSCGIVCCPQILRTRSYLVLTWCTIVNVLIITNPYSSKSSYPKVLIPNLSSSFWADWDQYFDRIEWERASEAGSDPLYSRKAVHT